MVDIDEFKRVIDAHGHARRRRGAALRRQPGWRAPSAASTPSRAGGVRGIHGRDAHAGLDSQPPEPSPSGCRRKVAAPRSFALNDAGKADPGHG
jgi:hypothetical protein